MIQSKAHHALLAKRGYNTKMDTSIVFGPQAYGGADFTHLYDIQGIGQISTFMKFWRSPSEIPGQLLRTTMQWAQYCAGTSWSILMNTDTPLPHLETKWLMALRHYLNDMKG